MWRRAAPTGGDRARGVYRAVDDTARTHADDLRELLLARRSDWAAARRSAAVGFGLPLIGRAPAVPQLLRERGDGTAEGTDRHERIGSLPDSQTVVHDGYLSCSPARAVADIAREEPLQAGVEVEPQVELLVDGLVVARFDLLVRSVLLALESNGAMTFDGEGVLPALLRRQEVIRDCRIDVVNVCWDEVFGATKTWQSRLLQRVAGRGSPPALPPGVELRSTAVRPQKPLLTRSALRGAVTESREVGADGSQRRAG